MAQLLDGGAAMEKPTKGEGAASLLVACQSGQVDVAQLLLEKGADVHKASNANRTPLHEAPTRGI